MTKVGVPFLFIWAGIALGGNMIAAPAKFQVSSIPVQELLMIGRAQFSWVGFAEWAFLIAALILAAIQWSRATLFVFLAAAIFLLQQFWMQPILEARTDQMLAGNSVPDGHMHLYFIAAEGLKILLLMMAGTLLLFQSERTS